MVNVASDVGCYCRVRVPHWSGDLPLRDQVRGRRPDEHPATAEPLRSVPRVMDFLGRADPRLARDCVLET